jgi:predicted nucleic acid-binding protein
MSREKPTVYLETNIFSSLHYRGGGAVASARRLKTEEWWELERKNYEVFTSQLTVDELSRGVYKNQPQSVAAAGRLPHLFISSKVSQCAALFIDSGLIPETEFADAVHLASATIYCIDYLMTWNRAHLAKGSVQEQLITLCKRNGWRSPLLVSPRTIPWSTLGQDLRRKE